MDKGTEATNYGVKLSSLARQARNLVRDLDPSNDLTFLRITCKKYEMMIAPDKDYFLIVIQTPGEDEAHWFIVYKYITSLNNSFSALIAFFKDDLSL